MSSRNYSMGMESWPATLYVNLSPAMVDPSVSWKINIAF